MTSFSERMGFVKPPEFMQLDGMTEELSNLLVNFCAKLLSENRCGNPKALEDGLNNCFKRLRGTFQLCREDFGLSNSGFSFAEDVFSHSFDSLVWHQKYTAMEAIVNQVFSVEATRNIGRRVVDSLSKNELTTELNRILERENSGYRLNANCRLVPIANQQELDEVSEAQQSKVDMVSLHMNRAVACFADREKPDYDNSIKEAVSALEALAQKITGETGKNATLGKLSKQLDLHPSLREAVSKLYGYTSDGGIRHAKKDGDPEVDFDTAKFVIVTASALINFITAKCIHV
jgi:hypothetical protein